MRKIIWLHPAKAEFLGARSWYGGFSIKAARRFRELVIAKLAEAAEFPERFSPSRVPHARRILIPKFPYPVHFRFNDTTLTVLAVFHDSRDPGRLLDR